MAALVVGNPAATRSITETMRGDARLIVHANETGFVPTDAVQSLRNPGTLPLNPIEARSGSRLGGNDIVCSLYSACAASPVLCGTCLA